CGDYPAWRGIAVDSSGNVFVVQTESGCDAGGGAAILKFSPSGGTPTIFPANIDPNNFGAGAAIAFGSDGKLYVSNYSGFFAYALDGTRTVVASPKDGFHAFCFDKGSADLTVSLRRGASTSCFANATPAAGVDDALTPVSDPNVLDSQPVVTAGLVADGVTPLLIKFTPSSALPQPTQYKVTFGFPNGGSANVSAHLASLSGPFASGTITLSGSTPVWDYLSAFNPQDI